MLLGLAVLLLNVCENKISTTCYKIQDHGGGGGLQPWLSNVVGTDKVKGCACCLAKTEGVTECFTKVRFHTDQIAVCFVHRGGVARGHFHRWAVPSTRDGLGALGQLFCTTNMVTGGMGACPSVDCLVA